MIMEMVNESSVQASRWLNLHAESQTDDLHINTAPEAAWTCVATAGPVRTVVLNGSRVTRILRSVSLAVL